MKKICILFMTVFLCFSIISTGWAATIPPDRPSDLKAESDNSYPMIKLTWDDNSDNEYGFVIERNGSQIADMSANVTTYYDRELSPNIEYSYTVRSFNEVGNSRSSNEASAVAASIPKPPSYPGATAISSSKIELTWEDNSDNETGFKIERKKSGEVYSQIKTMDKDITTYFDTGLTGSTKYIYRVRAYNNMGNSKYSTDVSVSTAQPATIIKLIVGSASYYIDNQPKTMDTTPIIKDSRTLLPIKYVAEAIGANVTWNNNERKVTITLKGTTIELWIGVAYARVNGVNKLIDSTNTAVTPIIVEPGRTMLPIRFISENLGAKVDWNSANREITVTYSAP